MITQVGITGAGGRIGSVLTANLADKYKLTLFYRKHKPARTFGLKLVQADLSHEEQVEGIFDGLDAVIHLAANPSPQAPWGSILTNNMIATYNVYEEARRASVSKIVFASTNHVTGLYENDEPYRSICSGHYDGLDPSQIPRITHTWPIRPDSLYGVSKAFGEALGRYYAEAFGIETLCLRIGSFIEADRPIKRSFATLLAHSDCVSLINACLRAKGVLFDVFYGVSANTWRFWDISHARDILGWIPQVNAELFR